MIDKRKLRELRREAGRKAGRLAEGSNEDVEAIARRLLKRMVAEEEERAEGRGDA